MHRSPSPDSIGAAPTVTGLALVLALALLIPRFAAAQSEVVRSLSIEEAVELARANNPGFQATRNDVTVDDWNVRSAYGSLYTPSVSANGGISWQGSGEVQLGTLTSEQLGFADQPSFLFSNYGLNVNYSLDGRTIMAPGQAKATRTATRAQIRSAESDLILRVTQSYLEILRQEEALRLARQELERARYNLRLAEGQREVGSASELDVRQAEVAEGRAEVGVLRTETALETARVRFLQELGLDLEEEVELTSRYPLSEPTWEKTELYRQALDANPRLRALRAQEEAASYGVKMARSSYFPSLSMGASFSGFTREATSTDFQEAQARVQAESRIEQCQALNEIFRRLTDPLPTQDCSQFQLTDQQIQRIREANDAFPFDFTSQPAQLFLSVSVPVFQGLGRQREVEAAQVQRDDARHRLREQELALRAEIASGLANVRTAYRTAVLEARNQEVAAEQLRLARERYQLGSASFLDLVEAETVKAQADRERVAAVYAYHDVVAALEAVVGTTLRTPEAPNP